MAAVFAAAFVFTALMAWRAKNSLEDVTMIGASGAAMGLVPGVLFAL